MVFLAPGPFDIPLPYTLTILHCRSELWVVFYYRSHSLSLLTGCRFSCLIRSVLPCFRLEISQTLVLLCRPSSCPLPLFLLFQFPCVFIYFLRFLYCLRHLPVVEEISSYISLASLLSLLLVSLFPSPSLIFEVSLGNVTLVGTRLPDRGHTHDVHFGCLVHMPFLCCALLFLAVSVCLSRDICFIFSRLHCSWIIHVLKLRLESIYYCCYLKSRNFFVLLIFLLNTFTLHICSFLLDGCNYNESIQLSFLQFSLAWFSSLHSPHRWISWKVSLLWPYFRHTCIIVACLYTLRPWILCSLLKYLYIEDSFLELSKRGFVCLFLILIQCGSITSSSPSWDTKPLRNAGRSAKL